jgi:hypothetical protein
MENRGAQHPFSEVAAVRQAHPFDKAPVVAWRRQYIPGGHRGPADGRLSVWVMSAPTMA